MALKIPPEMARNGRPKIDKFDRNENLYRRVPPQNFGPRLPRQAKIPLYAILLPDASVNRAEPNGEPQFVLYGPERNKFYGDWGIVRLTVNAAIQEVHAKDEPGRVYRTSPHHAPTELNYYHCEIRMFDGQAKHLKSESQIPDEVQQRWRVAIRDRLELIKKPEDVWAPQK